MAAPGTDISNDLGVGGKGKGVTEINNGLFTPNATPEVDDGRIDAEKARQAAAAAAAETKSHHSGDESDSDFSDDDGGGSDEGMGGVEANDDVPWPTNLVQRVYQDAAPYLGKLLDDPTDLVALAALKALNERIKQQNENDEIQPDQWAIDIPFFASQFEMAKPYFDRLLKRPEGTPADEEAKAKLEEINVTLREKDAKHHYPMTWIISPPTEETVAAAQAAKKGADETLAKRKAKRAAEKAAAEEAAADKAAFDKAAADKAAADKAAAGTAAVGKVVVDTDGSEEIWEYKVSLGDLSPPDRRADYFRSTEHKIWPANRSGCMRCGASMYGPN